MHKPSLLYASPLPPMRSGISDYSAALVWGLTEHFDVTLAIDDYEPSDERLRRTFDMVRFNKDEIDWERYKFRLYNIGNSPWFHGHIYEACLAHPGTVILHDFVIYYLVVGWYMNRPNFYTKVYEMAGPEGVHIIKEMRKQGQDLLQYATPQALPLTGELLASGNSILCHSRHALTQCEAAAPPNVRIGQIPLAWSAGSGADRAPELRRSVLAKWNIPADALVIASFGYVAPTKLNHEVCEAIRRHNQRSGRKAYYVMVGEGDYVSDRLDEFMRITGFVDSNEFEEWISAADLIVNLRFPSMGETSAATIHALMAGKPCVVTDDAWFGELGDDIVLKLPFTGGEGAVSGLEETLRCFAQMPQVFHRMGGRAQTVAQRDYSVLSVCRKIADFLESDKTNADKAPRGRRSPVTVRF